MYIWRVNKLAEEFRAGTVTDRQQLPYLLFFIGLTYLISDPYISSLLGYDALNTFDMLMLPMGLILGIGGTLWCYTTALRTESGAGFISRYVCLGIPIFVRIIVAVFAVIFAAFAINDFVIAIPGVDEYLETEETGIGDLVMTFVIELVFFRWLRQALRISYANA